jgi:hypothetical protein
MFNFLLLEFFNRYYNKESIRSTVSWFIPAVLNWLCPRLSTDVLNYLKSLVLLHRYEIDNNVYCLYYIIIAFPSQIESVAIMIK